MKLDTYDDDAHGIALARLLHDEVDERPVSGVGWTRIHARMRQRRARMLRLLPVLAVGVVVVVAASVVGAGVVGDYLGDRRGSGAVAAGQPGGAVAPIWPGASAGAPSWQQDPGQTAVRFLATVGVATAQLRAEVSSGPQGRAQARVTDSAGNVLATVHLVSAQDTPGRWQVSSVDSATLRVRSPQAGARFDPPLSVTFRSTRDARVAIRLVAVGSDAPLAQESSNVDAGFDWTAHANFTPTRSGTSAYLALTAQLPSGETIGVTVIPVTLGPN